MHMINDENGNPCPHSHTHEHCHESHCHEGHCHGEAQGDTPADKDAALLKYMLDHNAHHAAELEQMAQKLAADGHTKAADQIRKAVDEFQKGGLYLNLALSLVDQE